MFQVMSVVPFSAKDAFVTAYLLESSLARFKNATSFPGPFPYLECGAKKGKGPGNEVVKNVVCYFQTISCLLSFKEGNQWISSASCVFSPR